MKKDKLYGYLTPKVDSWIAILNSLEIKTLSLIDLIPESLPLVGGYWKEEPIKVCDGIIIFPGDVHYIVEFKDHKFTLWKKDIDEIEFIGA